MQRFLIDAIWDERLPPLRQVHLRGATHFVVADISEQTQRDLAATTQAAFEAVVVRELRGAISDLRSEVPKLRVTGLVVTGGCALNIKVNTRLQVPGCLRAVPTFPAQRAERQASQQQPTIHLRARNAPPPGRAWVASLRPAFAF